MKTTNCFNLLRSALRSRISAIPLALLLGASSLTPLFANPEYLYSGHDTANPQIMISLTITGVSGGYDVTGTIRDGNYYAIVTGSLAGSRLTALAEYKGSSSTIEFANVTGTLFGNLGSGVLSISTGPILFNVTYAAVSGMLTFVAPPPTSTTTPPQPPKPVLPASVHMSGGTGFGYTSVQLTLNTTLNGSSYDVTGTIVVTRQSLSCPPLTSLCRSPQPVTTTNVLDVSGVLTPGVQGVLNISDAPSGNSAHYTGTIASDGTAFSSFLSGLPTLGITGLYINASQEPHLERAGVSHDSGPVS